MEKSLNSKFIIILLTFTFILLSLSACSSSGGRNRSLETNAQTGKDGVSVNFMASAPPSVAYFGKNSNENEIPVELEVYNHGTSKTSVEIVFHGFDENIIGIDRETVDFTTEDSFKTRFNPKGGYDAVSTKLSVKQMPVGTYSFPLKATYCYNYDTIAGIVMCVDPSPQETRGDTCSPSKITTSGQGGPVGIDSIETEYMPKKIRVKMNIKHYSKSQIASPSTTYACSEEIKREDRDYVKITEVSLGDVAAEFCSIVDDMVRLQEGSAQVICTFNLKQDAGTSYNTILRARVEYVVKDTTEKNIKIINED